MGGGWMQGQGSGGMDLAGSVRRAAAIRGLEREIVGLQFLLVNVQLRLAEARMSGESLAEMEQLQGDVQRARVRIQSLEGTIEIIQRGGDCLFESSAA